MDHKHALIRATIENAPKKPKELKKWLLEVVDAISMKVLMEPKCKYLKTKGNRGISGVVMIETSHISIHIWDEASPALVQMDVYSCKDFDVTKVIGKLEEFDVKYFEYMLIDRNGLMRVI